MDARETLERRIDELCRENEKLRQYNNTLRNQVDTAKHNSVRNTREYARLCHVNDKLRQLVLDMRTCIDHACMCEFCPLFVTEEDMGERRCIADMKAHMRELGVDDG